MHLTRAALLAALCAAAAPACSGCFGQGPLPVRKVLVDVEPAAAGVDREQVRGVIDDVIRHARGIKIVDAMDGNAAVMRVRIEGYGALAAEPNANDASAANRRDGEGQPPKVAVPEKTSLALSLELTSLPGDAAGSELRGHALASGTGAVDVKTLVGQAVRDALAQVLMTRNAGELKSDELTGWLKDSATSTDQKKRAIRILGSRRDRGAVDAIGKILTGGDKELQPIALAALTNIGDPSGVDAVIAYSDRQPAIVKRQCIEAVRSMGAGSEKAEAWLFTLSTGAPELDVQEAAGAALAQIEAHQVKAQTVAEHLDTQAPKTATP